jgi:2',3'-cyclic-nucleotide 2'-phosphodiesterase (5'-nucleotidase family)
VNGTVSRGPTSIANPSRTIRHSVTRRTWPSSHRKQEDLAVAEPSGTVDMQILAVNDFHGNLVPPSGSSGRGGCHPVEFQPV